MASGDTLCVWTAHSGFPPATNYATLDTRNTHPVLDFDATTSETIYFEDVLPANYSGGGVTVTVFWMATSATSGAVVWGGAFEEMIAGGTDMDADSFATVQNSAASNANGTSGILSSVTIAHTSGANMDTAVAGDPFRYSLARLPADAGDTMTGDAELVRVVVKET